jgi:hypothetical protein
MNEPVTTPESVPAHTTPTWEMELLVSGATIFGLLQLPQLLDHGYFRAVNFMPPDYANLLMPAWMYAKIAVVTLVMTFLAHLCLRGYWVALVGMNSVYPGGIRWERTGLGPVARERIAAASPGSPTQQMAEAIERADNRATRVFGVGFSLATLMLAPLMLVLLTLVLGLVVNAVLGPGHTIDVLWFVIGVVLLPWVLAVIIDRRLPGIVARAPLLRRAIGAIAGFYSKLGFGPRSNPVIALYASHAGRLQFVAIALLVILPVSLIIVLGARGKLPFVPSASLIAIDPYADAASPTGFYDDQRGDGWAMLPLPHVPSRVVDGPYLELYVPFIPRVQAEALPRACPELAGAGADARARLACLARLADIRLDGAPVSVPLDATTDPKTGQAGVLAMIPVGALAPGRHELSLNEPDRRDSDGAPMRRYRIPFWK